ncbi:MAG: hypothetical protein WDW36_009177 [Sanguina aurantia]
MEVSGSESLRSQQIINAGVVSAQRDHFVFLSGAISGIVEGVTIQPLELLKTRFQINTGPPMSIIPALREIIREGGVRQLYRGALPEITGLVPRATAALSTLEFSRKEFRARNGGQLSVPAAYLSGAMAGVPEGIAFAPFQVIKVRLMAKEHLGRYRNTMDCLTKVISSEGVVALTIGLGPTLCRNCIWNSLYYGTMAQLDRELKPLENAYLNTGRTVLLGIAVGMTATCFNAPFDVVKSRFQSQLPDNRKYTSTIGALTTIYQEEGPQALYKGFWPKAMRLGIGQTFGLMVFQALLKVFDVHEEAEE